MCIQWLIWGGKIASMPDEIKILPDSKMSYGSNIESKIVFSQLLLLTESEFVLLGTFSQGIKNEIRAHKYPRTNDASL